MENLKFYVLFSRAIDSDCSFNLSDQSLGDLCGGGTPGPIPNPAVKPASADDTWRETARESRSSPRDFSLPVLAPGTSHPARASSPVPLARPFDPRYNPLTSISQRLRGSQVTCSPIQRAAGRCEAAGRAGQIHSRVADDESGRALPLSSREAIAAVGRLRKQVAPRSPSSCKRTGAFLFPLDEEDPC